MARFDFKRRRRRLPSDETLGLVVGTKALLVHNDKGEVTFDELAEREKSYRTDKSRPLVEFDDGETQPWD